MEEAMAAFIEGSTFMVASIQDNMFLQVFLKAVPDRLKLCRQLNFDYFSRFPGHFEKNADLELAAQCTGLHTIKLMLHYDPLTYMNNTDDEDGGVGYQPCAAQDLFEQFRLQRLLDCNKLRTIIMEHTVYHVPAAFVAAKNLGDLLTQKFAQRTTTQKVSMVYTRQPPRPRTPYYYY
jgi:hypothetical protein